MVEEMKAKLSRMMMRDEMDEGMERELFYLCAILV